MERIIKKIKKGEIMNYKIKVTYRLENFWGSGSIEIPLLNYKSMSDYEKFNVKALEGVNEQITDIGFRVDKIENIKWKVEIDL